jgi:hypothetical protein
MIDNEIGTCNARKTIIGIKKEELELRISTIQVLTQIIH